MNALPVPAPLTRPIHAEEDPGRPDWPFEGPPEWPSEEAEAPRTAFPLSPALAAAIAFLGSVGTAVVLGALLLR
ncbi:MAG: hypothetical protein ABMB14_13995 [Myxococcota bacterium]